MGNHKIPQKKRPSGSAPKLVKESPGWPTTILFPLVMIFERIAKRFGPAGVVFGFIFLWVYKFADEPTQHEIVRELFFHATTKSPYVQLFFVFLVVVIVFDGLMLRRYLLGESAQVKKLRSEIDRLQSRLLEGTAEATPEVGQ